MSASRKALLLVFFLFLLSPTVSAQNDRESLENQKARLLEKIKETERILTQTSDKKQSSLGRLRALNQQIRTRTNLVRAIQSEITTLDEDISENQAIIDAMEDDLTQLKAEYAQMIYTTAKAGRGFNELTFLFASSTFNELFMRMKYIKQYSKARKRQGEQIHIVQDNLKEQITEVETQKADKQTLLTEELSENKKLEGLQGEQKALVTRLTRQERQMRKQLQEQKTAERELTDRIEAIIEAERRAAMANSVDMSALTEAFEARKGDLPWPVEEGFISSKYGIHRHPTLKRVTQNNPGIDIQTPSNAAVKAVFPGKVMGIVSVEGMGNSIIIQHGVYFSVYSRLKSVLVKKGDEVGADQMLGRVLTDSQNVSEVKFRIHNQKGSMDPETWLRSRINKP